MILMTITKIMMMISVMTMMMRNHQQERIFLERIPRKIADEDVSYTAEKPRFSSKSKVVPMKTQSPRGLEVVVIRPESMEDAKEITDTLLTGKAVVLNLEGIHVEIAQRIIDYSAGSTYAIRGNLQKITNYIFLVTPPNVDISGDIPEIVTGGIDLSSFNKNENRF